MNPQTKRWRKCGGGMLRRVDFALGKATVRLLAALKYADGRVYHVEDTLTGHRDFVGIEFLKRLEKCEVEK